MAGPGRSFPHGIPTPEICCTLLILKYQTWALNVVPIPLRMDLPECISAGPRWKACRTTFQFFPMVSPLPTF